MEQYKTKVYEEQLLTPIWILKRGTIIFSPETIIFIIGIILSDIFINLNRFRRGFYIKY